MAKSDGGSTSYYELPDGARELNDLIEHKNMSFALGNIFKACYRLGEKDDVDVLYDVNKIIYFANRLKRTLLINNPHMEDEECQKNMVLSISGSTENIEDIT